MCPVDPSIANKLSEPPERFLRGETTLMLETHVTHAHRQLFRLEHLVWVSSVGVAFPYYFKTIYVSNLCV